MGGGALPFSRVESKRPLRSVQRGVGEEPGEPMWTQRPSPRPRPTPRSARRTPRTAATACLLVVMGAAQTAGWAASAHGARTQRLARARPAPSRVRALHADGDDGEADLELAKLDMSVLAIHSLIHSSGVIIASGHFDPSPILTVQDLVDISGSLNAAASSSVSWGVAALLLARTGILRRPLERDAPRAGRVVLLVFCLAAPLSLACSAATAALGADWASAAGALAAESSVLPARLVVLVGWRVFIAPRMMF